MAPVPGSAVPLLPPPWLGSPQPTWLSTSSILPSIPPTTNCQRLGAGATDGRCPAVAAWAAGDATATSAESAREPRATRNPLRECIIPNLLVPRVEAAAGLAAFARVGNAMRCPRYGVWQRPGGISRSRQDPCELDVASLQAACGRAALRPGLRRRQSPVRRSFRRESGNLPVDAGHPSDGHPRVTAFGQERVAALARGWAEGRGLSAAAKRAVSPGPEESPARPAGTPANAAAREEAGADGLEQPS